ncbi:MAG: hypothetical protein ACI8Y7_000229 [Candidatus Woesearchaeota archaeon]|jgi:hypothetical protein
MIVAVVIILIVALIVTLNNQSDKTIADITVDTSKLTPVQKYVAGCMDNTLREGLQRIGNQGGYAEIPLDISTNPNRYLRTHPNGGSLIPLWIYDGELTAPTIPDIETSLSEYITTNIGFCLNNQTALLEFQEIIQVTIPQAKVQINKEHIVVFLNYSITVTGDSQTQEVTDFVHVVPLRLKEGLELAQELLVDMYEASFFETATINLMAASDPMIPMSNMQFTCSRPVWQVREVERNIQDLLYYNLPKVRVEGAQIRPFLLETSGGRPLRAYENYLGVEPDDFQTERNGIVTDINPDFDYSAAPKDIYEYAHLYFQNAFAQRLNDASIKIGTTYNPSYGMDFTVRPSNGQIMKASTGSGQRELLRFLCLQMYHFTYDISYNLQMQVVFENAFASGEDFILRFGLPVVIDHNQPVQRNIKLQPTYGDSIESDFCEDTVTQTTTIRVEDVTNPSGFVSGVEAEFNCVKFSCPLGKTAFDDIDQRNQLKTNIPQGCYGGTIRVVKDGYVPAERYIEQAGVAISIPMTPLHELEASVVFGVNRPSVVPYELDDEQTAYVHIKDKFSNYENYYVFESDEQTTIELIDGISEYEVTLIVYDGTTLSGGFIDDIKINALGANTIVFHAYEFLPPPVNDTALIDAWTRLDEDQIIKRDYQPKIS